ncbi:biotin--[acetyl-CoA-carboxylase] ligase [Flavobacterium sp. RNTU_13]|uniref:biotin--[acetyl-CoA-carboxylase] ligase n=1 Tax=Flavobacterium sp. RNTU_13 TaxID=3375145 RepID=UPI0039856C24
MNIIKLSAINSTNDYLKQLVLNTNAENFTVVVAEHQTQGRGQMGAEWKVESGKNLTFSVLLKQETFNVSGIFTLNVAVALSVAQAVIATGIPSVSIKWPNDILAGNKKMGGILIENSIKSDGSFYAIIGIGLNVNQADFTGLPKATSMYAETQREFDKDEVLNTILDALQSNLLILQSNPELLWERYHTLLFKKGVPMPFEKGERRFMGIIQKVTDSGMLQVLLEDDSLAEYGIKEVQLLY